MRDGSTYRGARRNLNLDSQVPQRRLKNFKRVMGDNWKAEFDKELVKYNPPETSGYWPNREDLKHAGKLD